MLSCEGFLQSGLENDVHLPGRPNACLDVHQGHVLDYLKFISALQVFHFNAQASCKRDRLLILHVLCSHVYSQADIGSRVGNCQLKHFVILHTLNVFQITVRGVI